MKTIPSILLLASALLWLPTPLHAEQQNVHLEWSLPQNPTGLAGFHIYESGSLVQTVPVTTIPDSLSWKADFTMDITKGVLSLIVKSYDAQLQESAPSPVYDVNVAPYITSFTATPSNPADPNIAVSLSVVAHDLSGDPLTFSIDFGDGSAPANGSQAVHNYKNVGNYHATVTVSDGKGNIVTKGVDIAVTNTLAPNQVQGVSAK